jgi:formamidopyrimidine-DNA glycosylase
METFTHLGPDVWSGPPNWRQLGSLLAGRTAPIKALLLDQRVLAGLGNIYADEILHKARLRPLRQAGSLSPDEVRSLRSSIHPVLKAGIEAGGTTLGDLAYLLPDGRAGENLGRLRVYGREGLACRRCGAVIERVIVGGRSSFFCPSCQR